MSAVVIPFPSARRRHFIARQARRLADASEPAAERILASQLRLQRAAMQRRGIDPALMAKELRCLESAIRGAVWPAIFGDLA
jgi:Family of unknown function (DUF6074)